MTTTAGFQHFKVLKTWADRVKVCSPVIQNCSEKAHFFQVLLNKRPEIKELVMTVSKGDIDIRFDANALPAQSLMTVMDALLANVVKKPQNFSEKKLDGAPQHLELVVDGMSCPACALLIEMSLKKDVQIVDASADLESKHVKVYGTRELEEIVTMIEKLGYTHIENA